MPLGHGHITLNPPVKLTMVKCKLLSKKCEGSNTMYISVKKVVETFGFQSTGECKGSFQNRTGANANNAAVAAMLVSWYGNGG